MPTRSRLPSGPGTLADQLAALRTHPLPPVPRTGWLRAIREASALSTRELAAHLGISQPAVIYNERAEVAGTISLAQLARIAGALGCEVRYVLIPRVAMRKRTRAAPARRPAAQPRNCRS
ncbi:MAG: hypothetical protein ABI886_10185 [Betaproteobacteria bacterium]